MSNLIKPITKETKHDWTIEVDGQSVDAKHVVFDNPKFGKLSFGQRPEGTVGWMWHEASGGDQGVVPFSVINNLLYIGLIQEERPTIPGRFTWNIPRGFINPGETHLESAKRKLKEEFFSVEIPPGILVRKDGGFIIPMFGGGTARFLCFEFRDGSIRPATKIGEKIGKCLFVDWRLAALVPDTFTGMGTLKLLAENSMLRTFL
ncbi:MAG: NUDIX domain-containing protein [Candidatus Yanofskybacteria bacterium]|nr:NUDIX domain-containing protein [Candidatus Yanofskybacteria bacterium]